MASVTSACSLGTRRARPSARPSTPAQAYLIGQTLAAIHVAADRYLPDAGSSRYTLGERTLLDRLVAELEPLTATRRAPRRRIR